MYPQWLSQPRAKALALAIAGLFSLDVVKAGNTTCAGNLTDWYTNAVGETACETYQRLRQICNPQYQVPSFRPNTPGDQCDDQLHDCCCNSISWALSMLCMNCQWDVIGGSPNGIDAGVGAYGMYRAPTGAYCSPGTNQSLPADIRTAACNADIKLDNFLHELFWNDGSCVYTMDTASRDQVQNNNNTFTHCNSTMSTTSSALPSTSASGSISASSSTPLATQVTSSPQSSHPSTASVAGGAVGGAVGLALLLRLAFTCWRKRRHQRLPTTDVDWSTTSTMSMLSPYPSSKKALISVRRSYRSHHTRFRRLCTLHRQAPPDGE
ncbi:hypothetical protein PAXRUDRAFT_152079 [Paxillus rubicundulus Ve08.2h10]|uniref:Unplaced genomic scaffold scaffold_704, whole genome shotgun sequence n=1 Tax=Paxillus rubicundulus Ve08.2h10 TaxID=930991 RepID=A0A0D0DVV9_9AGAM|nr:hypothetical protein PAXRUDRAFT_152079 [Paxillus rubicundulus Ve08.2h10]